MSYLDQGLGMGLSTAPIITKGRTRSITPENVTGAPGAGGKAAGPLGAGRKGAAYIDLPRSSTVLLADIDGPGVIQHIWCTVTDRTEAGPFVLRDLVLRMYWDGEERPSVEVPLGDFFLNGFGQRWVVNSLPLVVNPTGGMNCYFPMPFARHARITIENQHAKAIPGFFYTINYTLVDQLPQAAGYFHAQWRRENLTREGVDYTVVDGIEGAGQYVGTYFAWNAMSRYWWGEGEMKFYIDDDGEYPTICGTGTEDYVGGAWSFYERDQQGQVHERTYNTPYLGYPMCTRDDATQPERFGLDSACMHGLYRFHLLDPIRFEERLRVTVQQIGHNGRGLFERTDDISSVGYWYQREPHAAFPELPSARKREPR